MSRIIDLSMPIADHFRWPVERRVAGDQAKGDVFQATWLGWTVHGFTHMDSPRHCVPGGATTDDVALETTVGEAAVVDLAPVAPNEALSAERLAAAAGHVRPGDIVVLRSCWEQQRAADHARVLDRGALPDARGGRVAAGAPAARGRASTSRRTSASASCSRASAGRSPRT